MTEFDPLAEVIRDVFYNTHNDSPYPVVPWHRPDWQASAQAARRFIAADTSDFGWVEVEGPSDIRKGDEVRIVDVVVDRTNTVSGVAGFLTTSIWYTPNGYLLTSLGNKRFSSIFVRRAMQAPPTAKMIVAYEVSGDDYSPEGVVLYQAEEGFYRSFEVGSISKIPPESITRYAEAKVVVDNDRKAEHGQG